jgi:hypothetical protein
LFFELRFLFKKYRIIAAINYFKAFILISAETKRSKECAFEVEFSKQKINKYSLSEYKFTLVIELEITIIKQKIINIKQFTFVTI